MRRGAARSSLSDEAYYVIRDMVVTGEIAPGERLTVRPLANTLGLSPTPIIAALTRLAHEGVLESRPHRGFFVPEMSIADMREIYEVRRGLDLAAVRRCCESTHRNEIASLLLDQCDEQLARLEKRDIEGYRAVDVAFHDMVWQLCGNQRLQRLGSSLLDQMRMGNAISITHPGRGHESVREHREIAHAIAAGDVERAEAAVTDHLCRTAQSYAESYSAKKC
ncbi:MAG: GntR family transcriptional regulator [Bowdeniella nasicola]|nr:GntR family transcriptional regulator [Bowdeniella nasicola]